MWVVVYLIKIRPMYIFLLKYVAELSDFWNSNASSMRERAFKDCCMTSTCFINWNVYYSIYLNQSLQGLLLE